MREGEKTKGHLVDEGGRGRGHGGDGYAKDGGFEGHVHGGLKNYFIEQSWELTVQGLA